MQEEVENRTVSFVVSSSKMSLRVILAAIRRVLQARGYRVQQKKSAKALEQIKAAAIPQSLLILDKKRVRASDAQLPKVVIDNMPRMARRSKLPIVKAKVGSKVMNFMCDADVFEILPVKQEVKAMVGGIYIVSIKPLRGQTLPRPPKKSFFQRLLRR